jgi:prepilin-type N-terminal cleavage/methylation domain-containing protein
MEREVRTLRLGVRRRGFTLAELLVVVVIIVLLAGVGIVFSRDAYRKIQVERAALDFMLAAKYARVSAIERQSPCMIAVDKEGGRFAVLTYAVDAETGETAEVPLQGIYFRKPVELGGEVSFEEVLIMTVGQGELIEQEEAKAVVFLPDGTAQRAVIQIGDGRTHYTASISAATGRTKLQAGTADKVEIQTVDLDGD